MLSELNDNLPAPTELSRLHGISHVGELETLPIQTGISPRWGGVYLPKLPQHPLVTCCQISRLEI